MSPTDHLGQGVDPLFGCMIFRFIRGGDVISDTLARLCLPHEFRKRRIIYFQTVSNQVS
jgi:hypothetical protein